ncbi:unnamed protein product [Knipowitschia caucasica]|uniref:Cadherin domain-containing protein n=1 Tax=Knipowitschia caucasica TaxID=637954 RepID=A0AAV2MJH3_KNICA
MSHIPLLQSLLTVAGLSFMCGAVHFSVPEEQGAGVLVGMLRAHFPPPYQLLTLDYLWLDSNTGGLYTSDRRMDREELCPEETRADGCIVRHTAIVGDAADLVQFSVIIEDINDNAPLFENTEIHLSLSEDVTVGAGFLLDHQAQDRDIGSNGYINYFIEGSDGVFDVETEDGISVKLIVKMPLDREVQSEYNTSLVAQDGGSPPLKSAVVLRITVTDVNDNCPHFSPDSHQNVTISGDSPKNTVVAQVKATDADFGANSEITYNFSPKVSERGKVLFSLDSRTGSVILTQDLQSDISEEFVLKVLASGPHCSPADTQVTVSVLPRAKVEPTIKIGYIAKHENQTLVVAENEPPALLAVLELEADSGLKDSYLNIEGDVPFTLSHQRGRYLLSNSRYLDYEDQREHYISVAVQRTDQGSVITVSRRVIKAVVTDVNDNPPLFPVTVYELDVEENNQPGSLLQVTASDADSGDNSRVTYRLGEHTDRIFNIDRNTGQLFVSESLDRELQKIHTIRVTAQDSGSPPLETTATLRIRVVDKNDNAPVFVMPHFIFFVPENAPELSPVGTIGVMDADEGANGNIVMYVANTSAPFVIPNSKNTLHTTSSLDREMQDKFELWVIASDYGSPLPLTASVRITIYIEDINDNQPKVILPINNLTCLTVPADTTAGTTITRVYAIDQDTGLNSDLTYKAVNQNRIFNVDHTTGNITLTQRPLGSDIGMHNLLVLVSDRGKPSPLHTAVWVSLLVNDSLEACHLDCEPQVPPWPSPTTSERIECPTNSLSMNFPNQTQIILFVGLGMMVVSLCLFVGTFVAYRRRNVTAKKTNVSKNENEVPLQLLDKYYCDE